MGRGKALTTEERTKIAVYVEQGLSERDIAQKLDRSKTLVHDCIERGVDIPSGTSSGRKRALDVREVRHIRRRASNEMVSAATIKAEQELDVSTSTIRRAIHSSGYLEYEKKCSRPAITDEIAARRLEWGHAHMQWNEEWSRTIFSDEKKFNLDGPDGFAYYWHDLRKSPQIFSKRQQGGGSVMIWLAATVDYKSNLVVLDGNLNAQKYKGILATNLLPLKNRVANRYHDNAIFQQDRASPHTAHSIFEWLEERNIEILDWPSRSPDMNPIENVFGMLSRAVYDEGRQFNTVHELTEEIQHCWANMNQALIKNAIRSMSERIFELIEKHGKPTHY